MTESDLRMEFTVKAETVVTGFIYMDLREKTNRVLVGFDPPFVGGLLDPTPNDVAEHVRRREAEKVALELVSRLSGLDEEELMVLHSVAPSKDTLTVVPVMGRFPKNCE